MTAYAASVTGGISGAIKLTVAPSSTYQVRIARIEAFGIIFAGAGSQLSYTVNVYPGSTPTSGSAATVLSMRAGSPATTATVKTGATISGTNTLLHSESVGISSSAAGGDTASLNSNYTFPFDLILSSGMALSIASPGGNSITGSTITLAVYYEELRLAWSL